MTYVDLEAGERLEDAIRPLYGDKGGFDIGRSMRDGIVGVISSCFYLNKIALPDTGREMTAYEVQQRMIAYRRENLPLFAPMESDYNGQLCEIAFTLALNAGFFGSPSEIPKELAGETLEFKFRSPLSRAEEEIKANQYRQVTELLAMGVQYDDTLPDNVDFDDMLRESMSGLNVPESWLIGVQDVMNNRNAEAMAIQQQAMMGGQVGQ